jgi:hypothetical protein
MKIPILVAKHSGAMLSSRAAAGIIYRDIHHASTVMIPAGMSPTKACRCSLINAAVSGLSRGFRVVLVPAALGLLAEPAPLAELVGQGGVSDRWVGTFGTLSCRGGRG